MAESKPKSFEEGLEQLESVVQKLESDGLTLEQSLVEFEKGVKLAKDLQIQLEQSKRRVDVLKQSLNGELETRPLDSDSA
ncbi:MAG: exodeoxyribonuclease VII small subunit [Holophagaceae bacterium]|jgi:exodeoxyribonuclease VII small subunit